jgi:hypothetical protein
MICKRTTDKRMQSGISSQPSGGPNAIVPRFVLVTGPAESVKTRWLHTFILSLQVNQPLVRCAVVLVEHGRTQMSMFAKRYSNITVRKIVLPCLCCPALIRLSEVVRSLIAAVQAEWIFIEVPALAAASIVAEFDRVLAFHRSIVVCLDAAWLSIFKEGKESYFQHMLLNLADAVVSDANSSKKAAELVINHTACPTPL